MGELKIFFVPPYNIYMADLEPEKKAELEAQLIAKGVPENVANYAVEQSPKHGTYLRQNLIAVILMIAMFALGAFLWWLVKGVNNAKAAAAAESIGALMYRTNFGVSFFVAVIGGFLGLQSILSYFQLFSKTRRTASFVYGMPDSNSGFSWFKKPDSSLAPDDYIRAFFGRMAQVCLKLAALIFGIAVLVGTKEVYSYEIIGETQISESRLLSLSGLETQSIDDIDYVELGCNHVTGRGASTNLVYRIRMKNGSKIYLESAVPVHGNWLDNAMRIDADLEKKGVTFKRWSWRNRHPLHPECLRAQRRKNSPEDYERILKLLRADGLSE